MQPDSDPHAGIPDPYSVDYCVLGRGHVRHVIVTAYSPALELDRAADAWWLYDAGLPEPGDIVCPQRTSEATRKPAANRNVRLCRDCEMRIDDLDARLRRAREKAVQSLATTKPELFREVGW